jgi:pimeloyl-ACP methyl ester carboxylesterase
MGSPDRTRTGRCAVDGGSLAWQVAGDGPPVVLVHGFALDRRMWDDVTPGLARDYTVISYDLRGFGASAEFDHATAYTHTDDLLTLLAHLGFQRAALVGLSFGGGVVLKTVLHSPESVTHLVLVDAVLGGVPWDEETSQASEAVDLAVRLGGVTAGRRAWCAHPLFAPANEHPDLAARLVEMVDGYPGQHWLGTDPQRPENEVRPIDVLDTITVATTVLVGDRDVPCFQDMASVLARGIPGARLVTIAGAGHMTPMEAPDAVLRALQTALVG